jgi:MYXO-CTERM domain-containing protein
MRKTLLFCGVSALLACSVAQASTIYGFNMRADNYLFTTTTGDFVGNFAQLGGVQPYDTFAIDMDPMATTLYAVLYDGAATYGTIDLTTGDFTAFGELTGPDPAGNVSGLSVDPTTGTWYLCSIEGGAANLYAGDITTGVFNLVGDIGFGLNIDIAIDSQGNCYGHDIGTDELLSIDLATGAGTAIGPTGVNTNYAQGMDFDYATDTLYATLYTGGGTGVFAYFDLTTGAANVLQDTTPLNAEMEMVVATPIPGPGALALLGLGLLGMRRRR